MTSSLRKIAAVVVAFLMSAPAISANSVSAQSRVINGVRVQVVTVNLNDPNLRLAVQVARGGIGSSESFWSMLRRSQPHAAITGTYFNVHSLVPIGDIVSKGKKIHQGRYGIALMAGTDNLARITNRTLARLAPSESADLVLCAGPTLLRYGRVAIDPRAEGFRDPVFWAQRPRTAVGITNVNKLLMVCVSQPIYLGTLARMLRTMGAVDAIGMDGGSSSALYANGKVLTTPGRSMTNLLVVEQRAEPSPVVLARLQDEQVAQEAKMVALKKARHPLVPRIEKTMAIISKP